MCLHGSVSLTSQVICDTQEVTIHFAVSLLRLVMVRTLSPPKEVTRIRSHLITWSKKLHIASQGCLKVTASLWERTARARHAPSAHPVHLVLDTATADSRQTPAPTATSACHPMCGKKNKPSNSLLTAGVGPICPGNKRTRGTKQTDETTYACTIATHGAWHVVGADLRRA